MPIQAELIQVVVIIVVRSPKRRGFVPAIIIIMEDQVLEAVQQVAVPQNLVHQVEVLKPFQQLSPLALAKNK
jgi:hypothetical protein